VASDAELGDDPSSTGDVSERSSDESASAGRESPLSAVPPTADHPIVLFDGVCLLCSGLVQFLIARESDATLRFAPLQSPVGDALLETFDCADISSDTFVFIDDGTVYTRSTAALRVLGHLDGLYPLLAIFLVIPRPLRDLCYRAVAKSRYSLFGRRDSCALPPGDSSRYLAGAAVPGESE
jgi:predicted DCC family thiol-disulfide oxidoreductase YuxK